MKKAQKVFKRDPTGDMTQQVTWKLAGGPNLLGTKSGKTRSAFKRFFRVMGVLRAFKPLPIEEKSQEVHLPHFRLPGRLSLPGGLNHRLWPQQSSRCSFVFLKGLLGAFRLFCGLFVLVFGSLVVLEDLLG